MPEDTLTQHWLCPLQYGRLNAPLISFCSTLDRILTPFKFEKFFIINRFGVLKVYWINVDFYLLVKIMVMCIRVSKKIRLLTVNLSRVYASFLFTTKIIENLILLKVQF